MRVYLEREVKLTNEVLLENQGEKEVQGLGRITRKDGERGRTILKGSSLQFYWKVR